MDDGLRGEASVVTTDEVGEAATEIRVGQEVRAAIVVMDDGNLGPGAPGDHPLGEVANVGEISQHVPGAAAAGVADHHRVLEPEFEECRRVSARVQAGDHVDRMLRDDADTLASRSGREVLAALKERIDVGHVRILPGQVLRSLWCRQPAAARLGRCSARSVGGESRLF